LKNFRKVRKTGDKVPNILYSLFITLATSFFAKKYQGYLVGMHIGAGGKLYETGRAVAVCIISILILVALVLIPFFLSSAMGHPFFSSIHFLIN
jgi:hypothetical protein